MTDTTGIPGSSVTQRTLETSASSKATVIGIYGVSESGKTTLLEHLRSTFKPADRFRCFEGSEELFRLMTQVEFRKSTPDMKIACRERAIGKVAGYCSRNGLC